MSSRMFQLSARNRRRGSVFVLVVAILAVIGLLTLTLAYSTRMELQASRNSADAVQARLSALTSVPFVTPGTPYSPILGAVGTSDEDLAASPSSLTSSNRSVQTISSSSVGGASGSSNGTRDLEKYVPLNLMIKPQALSRSQARTERENDKLSSTGRVMTDLREKNRTEQAREDQTREGRLTEGGESESVIADMGDYEGGMATSRIQDESAKLNVNAVLPAPKGEVPTDAKNIQQLADPKRPGPSSVPNATHLAMLIEQVAQLKDLKLQRSATDLANDIVKYRYGDDGVPGISGLDDNGNSGSVRPGSDGLDNDGDWVIDNPEEETLAVDADGQDNDLDGIVDQIGETLLKDGLDNDNNGVVDDATEAVDDPQEFSADIRIAASGDDRPYQRLSDLTAIRGMSPELIAALTPYLTVFSVSQPAFAEHKTSGQTSSDLALRQLDPNTAHPEDIFEALRAQYPSLPEALLGQFAVNIVDRRDLDGVPTESQLGMGGTTFRGLELNPGFSEVFPYTGGFDQEEGGDDGQFFEIVNPFTTPIDVTGWRVEGVGTSIYLNGTIQGGGLLVYTDDYNNSLDPEPEDIPGQGSLYDIFGAVPTGGKTRLEVNSAMEMPNETGALRLYNKEGALIDEFRYEGGKLAGVLKYAYQREDPRVRKTLYTRDDCDYGTPLKSNQTGTELNAEERRMMELVEQFYDRPFLSPLEILLVPTNYNEADEAQSSADPSGSSGIDEQANRRNEEDEPSGRAFRLPFLASSATAARLGDDEEKVMEERSNNLDVTVVDLFLPGLPARRDTRMMSFFTSSAMTVGDSLNQNLDPRTDRIEMEWNERRDRPQALHGRINVNTAAPVVISSLPGMGTDFAYVIATLREKWMFGTSEFTVQSTAMVDAAVMESKAWTKAVAPLESVRWRSLSDFLCDDEVWGPKTLLVNRIEGAYPFASMICFNTLSYRVVTENIPPPDKSDRKPTIFRTERIIAGDRGRPETVRFAPMFHPGWIEEDKDIKFGVSANSVNDYSHDLLAKADSSPALPRYSGANFPASVPNIPPTRANRPALNNPQKPSPASGSAASPAASTSLDSSIGRAPAK